MNVIPGVIWLSNLTRAHQNNTATFFDPSSYYYCAPHHIYVIPTVALFNPGERRERKQNHQSLPDGQD
jgi:hypothetical protein